MDSNMPIKGKCTWWRERMFDDDAYDTSVKREDKRVSCTCFVEGDVWTYPTKEVPRDCPKSLHCRYYIKNA